MAPGAATASCAGAFPIAGSCTECCKCGLCRPEGDHPHHDNILKIMIDAEPAHASSTGTEPAGAATGEDTGRNSKAPAACDSPGSPLTQAAGGEAIEDGLGQRSSRAEAAQPGSVLRQSRAPAAASSSGGAPGAGIGGFAAGLSLEGQASSLEASAGSAEAGGSPPVASSASSAVAESSTARGQPPDRDATDGVGGKEQTSSAEGSPVMPCSAIAAGDAAMVDGSGQAPSHKAGRQPADTGSTQRKTSCSTHTAQAGKQQAAHDGQNPDVAQVCSCGPPTPFHMP